MSVLRKPLRPFKPPLRRRVWSTVKSLKQLY
jgi:hypothetical protein